MTTSNGRKIDINEAIELLIKGHLVIVPDENKKEVQQRLREIKTNCTTVLRQLNDNNF